MNKKRHGGKELHTTKHHNTHITTRTLTMASTFSRTNGEVDESFSSSDSDGDVYNNNADIADIADIFMPAARDIMNRPSQKKASTMSTEARFFRETFGTRLIVVEILWDLLDCHGLQPEDGRPKHLLWALHFMKAYPLQATGCATVGGSGGAIDAKTYRKWVWEYIEAISLLVHEVVRFLLCLIYFLLLNNTS